MYASAIGAGVSQLWNLLRRDADAGPSSSAAATPASTSGAGAATGTGTGASGQLSADLNTLMLHLQSGGTSSSDPASADPTSTVAGDLQNVFGDLGKAAGGGRGHHHHGGSATDAAGAAGGGSASPGFQNLASSLLAYSKAQGQTSSSASVTA